MTSSTDTISRIRKLLALASHNSNEHEAERAMRKASELMIEHGISHSDVTPRVVTRSDPLEFKHVHERTIANAVAMLFACSLLTSADGFLLFCGREANIRAAVATYTFLMEQVIVLYRSSLPKGLTKVARASFRRDFKDGLAMRILERVGVIVRHQEAHGISTSSRELVVSHRQNCFMEIDEFLKAESVPTRDVTPPSPSTAAGHVGYMMGDRVVLQPIVT